MWLSKRVKLCKYRKSKRLTVIESKYSGSIDFNGQIFKMFYTLFEHYFEHNILSHLYWQ